MRYVGLDLSTKTGIVIIENGEVILDKEIQEKCDTPESMVSLANQIVNEIDYGDSTICIEGFGYASQQGFTLGGIGWVVRVQLWLSHMDFHLVAPATLKKFASGKGAMKKDNLAVEIYKRWGYQHTSDNVRDAFVLAQIAQAIGEQGELPKFQQEAIETVLGRGKSGKKNNRK